MALATTCPQCKTSFKVVPDQLKLRRGMVRCGMCQHVFSGIDFLRYVDEGARKAAGPGGARGPATVTERPEREPVPADHGHTDLKTAFFLPETVFQPTAVVPPPSPSPPPPPAVPPMPAAGGHMQVPESLQARPARSHASGLTSTPGGIIVQTGTVAGAAAREREPAAPAAPAAPDEADAPDEAAEAADEAADETTSEIRPPDDGVVAPSTIPADEPAIERDASAATDFPIPAEPQPVVDADDGRSAEAGAAMTPAPGLTAEPGRALEPEQAEDLAPLSPASLAEPPPRNRRATDRIQVIAPPGPAVDDQPAVHDAPAADDGQTPPEDTLTDSTQRDVDAVRASFESERRSRWFRRDTEEADAIDYFGDERRVRGFSGRAAPLMWIAYGVLSVLLALQLLMGFAPRLFELHPNIARPFATLLSPWRTRAEMPRNLKALSIESFELAASPTPGVLLLSAVLRNDAASGVKWPAMELSLTDGGGALLVRKVIMPDDYLKSVYADRPGAAREGLSANAELPLRLALEAHDLTPAGYSVTLFYP